MSAIDDLVSTAKGAVTNLSQIITVLGQVFPRVNGTFTLSAATTTIVAQPSMTANGIVSWTPTNSAAALLLRTNGLYVSAGTAGSGFAVSTQSGAAVGTETFQYFIVIPV